MNNKRSWDSLNWMNQMKTFHKIQDGMGAPGPKLQSLYVDYIVTVAEALVLVSLGLSFSTLKPCTEV